MMLCKLIQSILFSALLTLVVMAQPRRSEGESVRARALELEPYIIESANRYRIDARVLRIVCFMESRFRVNAVSPKGALGPMQFMPDTARRYGLNDPHDPRASIDAAAHYFRDLLRRFGGRVELALAAYNAGEGAVESFRFGRPLMLASGKMINPRGLVTGGVPPYSETRTYVRSGMALLFGRQIRSAKRDADSAVGASVPLGPEARDFTIDVTENEIPSWLRRKEKPKSFFIEVQ